MISTAFIFYLLASILILTCLLVVFLRNPIYNLLGLLTCFFTLSGIFMILGAEFLALIILLIYASSLIICFVFVLMGTDFTVKNNNKLCKASILGISVLIVEVLSVLLLKNQHHTDGIQSSSSFSVNHWTEQISIGLFNDYAYLTVVLAFIMLSGMVSVVLIINKNFNDKSDTNKFKTYDKNEALELQKVKFKEGLKR